MLNFKASIHHTRENVTPQYKNNKLRIIADEFELPDDSYLVPDIQSYIEYVIKKHEI